MSPESDTSIPTTPIKNTPVPLSTPLQHNSKFSTHTTKTYAEKHKHTPKTITPNTKTTTPSTETLKSSPKKPPKVTITPPPESITYTKKIGHIFKGGKKGTKITTTSNTTHYHNLKSTITNAIFSPTWSFL